MRPLNENESADVVIWGLTSESLHGVLSGDRLVPQVAAVKPGVGKAYSFSAYVYLLASLVAGVLGFLSGLAFTKGYREGGTDYVEIYERAKAGTGTIQPRATTK